MLVRTALCKASPGNKNTRLTYKIGSKSGAAAPLPIFLLHVIVCGIDEGDDRDSQGCCGEIDWSKAKGLSGASHKNYLNGSPRRAERVFGWGRHIERCWGSLENQWNGTLQSCSGDAAT